MQYPLCSTQLWFILRQSQYVVACMEKTNMNEVGIYLEKYLNPCDSIMLLISVFMRCDFIIFAKGMPKEN